MPLCLDVYSDVTPSLHDQAAAAMDDVLGETAEAHRDTETDGPLQ